MNIAQKLLLIGLLLFTSVLLAQGVPPPNPPPPNGLPIDGLVWLGGAIALIYGGIKKYYNPKK